LHLSRHFPTAWRAEYERFLETYQINIPDIIEHEHRKGNPGKLPAPSCINPTFVGHQMPWNEYCKELFSPHCMLAEFGLSLRQRCLDYNSMSSATPPYACLHTLYLFVLPSCCRLRAVTLLLCCCCCHLAAVPLLQMPLYHLVVAAPLVVWLPSSSASFSPLMQLTAS